MKQGFGKLASLEEAKKIIFSLVKEKENEKLRLENALNRVLAQNIVAKIDVPHFKKSAMDGFAVMAEDTFGASNTNPKELPIIERIKIGQVVKKELKSNQCVEIATGAPWRRMLMLF